MKNWYLNADEKKSIKSMIGQMGEGDTLYTEGVFYCGISINGSDKKIKIDGQGKSILFGYSTQYDPQTFNPAKLQAAGLNNYGAIALTDSHNIHIKGFDVLGGKTCLEFNSSNLSMGLKNLIIEDCKLLYGGGICVFSGMHWCDGITLKGCTIGENIYGGNNTHAVYFSGGHWDKSVGYGGCKNVNIIDCKIGYTAGRHAIQFNGRFDGVKVVNNDLFHAELSGLSLLGVQNALIKGNNAWGNQRQALVGFADGEDDIDWTNIGLVDWWLSHHWPNKNHTIVNNTLIVGPKQFRNDQFHNNDPSHQPVILYNNPIYRVMGEAVNLIRKELQALNEAFSNGEITWEEYKPKWDALKVKEGMMLKRQAAYRNENIRIFKNILHGTNGCLIDFYHNHEASASWVAGNWCQHGITDDVTPGGGINVAHKWYNIKDVQANFPTRCRNNVLDKVAQYRHYPTYPDSIKWEENKEYFWGREHDSKADLACPEAAAMGIGSMRDKFGASE